MTPRASSRLFAGGAVLGVVVCAAIACQVLSPDAPATIEQPGSLHPLGGGLVADGGGADAWIDCVGVLHVIELRGREVANAARFGEHTPGIRTTARLSTLAPADLRAFCDWEACIRANGYAHTCAVTDGGWESCRVCTGTADCNGRPMSQDECVAHAADPGRSQCHVGLLEECLLQQALRGPADPRLTQSCMLSERACAGQLPGDLSAQALAGQHETDQVTIEEFKSEIAVEAKVSPDSSSVVYWENQLALWDGGLPPGEDDAGDGSSLDGSDGD